MLDLPDYPIHLDKNAIRKGPYSLWRYRGALPFPSDDTTWQALTLGEGFTDLIPLGSDHPHVSLKIDYLMPTLSFKDRGAVVLMTFIKALGVTRIIADSSGNAGVAIAAYAARAGVASHIYIPSATSAQKAQQLKSYGAFPMMLMGDRAAIAEAAQEEAKESQTFYASHVYNPYFLQGMKTYAFELWEQLDGKMPEALIAPVGNGTLLLGAYLGCCDLVRLGLIAKLPRIIGVQAANCAPLATAFAANQMTVAPVENTGTIAEGIAITAPPRGEQILAAVRESKGAIISVPEEAIQPAQAALAKRGLHVEPTSAVNWAGYEMALADKILTRKTKVVIPLCGAGLKAG
jgi:threonine synthase